MVRTWALGKGNQKLVKIPTFSEVQGGGAGLRKRAQRL